MAQSGCGDGRGVGRFKTYTDLGEGDESHASQEGFQCVVGEVIVWYHPLSGRKHWIQLSLWSVGGGDQRCW